MVYMYFVSVGDPGGARRWRVRIDSTQRWAAAPDLYSNFWGGKLETYLIVLNVFQGLS